MKIFLDVGADEGESVAFFRGNHPNANKFKIYCFEPHPDNIQKVKQVKGITLFEAAAWIDNSGIEMYFGKTKSGSVYADKRTGNLKDKTFVPTIDLADFIKLTFDPADEIWLKMNIEGAEYKVIPHLHKEGVLPWIDRMYVKWHVSKIPSVTKEIHKYVQSLVPNAIPKWRCEDVLPLVAL